MSYSVGVSNGNGVDSSALVGMHKIMAEGKAKGKPVVGSWLQLPGASLARMTAQLGFDYVLLDCEHGDIDDGMMHNMVLGITSVPGVGAMIRIPASENWFVKRALDTGAHGILVPMVSTVAEAKRIVSFSKFPIQLKDREAGVLSGVRGAGSPFAPAPFGQTINDYVVTANKNTFVAIQIENEEGLANCEEIAKVEGIDMLFVGPNDLCCALGYDISNHPNVPEVQAAIERVKQAAHAAGKYAGMFCVTAEQVALRAEQGFDFVNLGGDTVALPVWNMTELGKLKKLMP